MYHVTIYTGGIYKFDEFIEFIEDLGGIVLKRDKFQISRGDYFLSEEVHALTVIPEKEQQNVILMAKKLKGNINIPKIDPEDEIKVLSCLLVHDYLSKAMCWINYDEIKNQIKWPFNFPMLIDNNENHLSDILEDVLDGMVMMEMVVKQIIDNETLYRINYDY
jgi:hypothetical protein